MSLRSSAIGEDSVNTSFAGQYRSELNVSPELLLPVYKEIVASKYALTAITYRLHKGIRDEDVAMCVGCMQMVDCGCRRGHLFPEPHGHPQRRDLYQCRARPGQNRGGRQRLPGPLWSSPGKNL